MRHKNFYPSFLTLMRACIIFTSSWSAAMEIEIEVEAKVEVEEPRSESSFHFFTTDEGTLGKLHDQCYTQQEIEIIENFMTKLTEPQSPEKDAIIAQFLVKQIKDMHYRSILDAVNNSCFYIPNSSYPRNNNLEQIAMHGLYGKKFLIFGRNRTFDILSERLLWIDKDNQPTNNCPSVFRKIWEQALGNKRCFCLYF